MFHPKLLKFFDNTYEYSVTYAPDGLTTRSNPLILHEKIALNCLLALEMKDRDGVEYHDQDIVECEHNYNGKLYPMVGVIQYSCGRFEIKCPWKRGNDLETIRLGMNPKFKIIGSMIEDETAPGPKRLIEQMKTEFTREKQPK